MRPAHYERHSRIVVLTKDTEKTSLPPHVTITLGQPPTPHFTTYLSPSPTHFFLFHKTYSNEMLVMGEILVSDEVRARHLE